MSGAPTPTGLAVSGLHSDASGNGLTPQNHERAHGTVVFLREEGQEGFVPLHRTSSVTLQELVEEFNISSVVECDARGQVQPRAVAFDSPSDVLHSGRHYVVRRDARAEGRGSRVTFRGKIQVKEYELEHATPPAHRHGQTDDHRPVAFFSAVGTPLPLGRRHEDELDDENSLSHTLVSGQKRPRDDTGAVLFDGSQATSSSAVESEAAMDAVTTTAPETGDEHGAPRPLFFSDRTNAVAARPGTKLELSKTHLSPTAEPLPDASAEAGEANKENGHVPDTTAAVVPSTAPVRFIPFSIDFGGMETAITLDDLKAMCAEDDSDQQRQRHEQAVSILQSARRVLFNSP